MKCNILQVYVVNFEDFLVVLFQNFTSLKVILNYFGFNFNCSYILYFELENV